MGKEAGGHAAQIGGKDTDLSGGAQQQGLRVGNEGAEVRHGPNSDKDQAGIQAGLDADVENVQQPAVVNDIGKGDLFNDLGLRRIFWQRGAVGLLVDDQAVFRVVEDGVVGHIVGATVGIGVPHGGVVEVGAGQVGEQYAHRDAHQQQRLKLLVDGQPEQHQANDNHHQHLPAAA